MKKLFAVLVLTVILGSMSVSSAQGLGGEIGFNRAFLRMGDETINLGAATPGLTFLVPFDAIYDNRGDIVEDGTHGMSFGTSILSDENLVVTSVRVEYWRQYGPVKAMLGPTLDFFDKSAVVPEQTNCVGVCGAVRFTAQGLPAELSGSWSSSYDGVEDLELSHIYLGLVGEF
jgi:hypothetical protein